LPEPLYLSGYWQSEKYFSPVSVVIRDQFIPARPLDERNTALQTQMQSQNSVAVHVRRGDYASASAYNSFFGVLPLQYYNLAMAEIVKTISNPVFYFFSDDPSWCKQHMPVGQAVFVDHNTGENAYKDLVLMSSCKHAIIANSTFSWWGAWLNRNPDKVVIAPRTWFQSSYLTKKEPVYPSRYYNTKDLIPATWTRL
ncbi:MAG: alpha-1,2-fucosyltransferase, partial [Cyclobacteriaceae bacterium]|nr:alpha-1,2-fucosyltransferase [Cyclobacteriaceae bacterium]